VPVLTPAALAIQRGGSTSEKIVEALGVKPSAVAQYCAGRRRPHPRLIPVVAELCGLDAAREVAQALGIQIKGSAA
jgi:DNA-binding transcriptional regulator YdaS (Cro superfamily)